MRDATLQTLPIRLLPGDDLRQAIEQTVRQQGVAAAFVVAGIGSLRAARIRLAGADTVSVFDGDTEMFTLSGTIAAQGSHLHLSIADAQGRVIGGHAAEGCIVRTTAEVLLGLLPGWRFERVFDPATGYAELVIEPNQAGEASFSDVSNFRSFESTTSTFNSPSALPLVMK